MKKILVTGVNGFVGKHLARELASRGIGVIGVGHNENTADSEISLILNEYYQCDVTDATAVKALPLDQLDGIINLAGLANVGASFAKPDLYMKVNVEVLTVLGEALINEGSAAKLIAVSTGALYGPNQPMPLSEDAGTITSGSPYALSKLKMEREAASLRERGLDCIVVRPFNHIGPGQGLGFLIPDLAQKLKSTNKERPEIIAGNLKTIRDYSDVRDIAKAYSELVLAKNLQHNLFNVCSGSGHSGQDILKALCANLDIDYSSLKVNVDDSLIRPSDPKEIVGDSSRLQKETSWKPTITLEKTVTDIVNSVK